MEKQKSGQEQGGKQAWHPLLMLPEVMAAVKHKERELGLYLYFKTELLVYCRNYGEEKNTDTDTNV